VGFGIESRPRKKKLCEKKELITKGVLQQRKIPKGKNASREKGNFGSTEWGKMPVVWLRLEEEKSQ